MGVTPFGTGVGTSMGGEGDMGIDNDSDNAMYHEADDDDASKPKLESPGTKSFIVTPESKPLATPGNVSVDFMDINEHEQHVTPSLTPMDEDAVMDESDQDENMLMYKKENKHKTKGMDDGSDYENID